MSFKSEWIRCGNPRCKSCPHGPYWYEYWREGGKLRKRYHGRARPGSTATAEPTRVADWWEPIFSDRTANRLLALRILDIKVMWPTLGLLKKTYREMCLKHHVDRGGDRPYQQAVNAAYAYLKVDLK